MLTRQDQQQDLWQFDYCLIAASFLQGAPDVISKEMHPDMLCGETELL